MIDTENLCKKYNRVLSQAFYPEIGEGWDGLVEDFIEEISEAAKDFKEGSISVSQIKEKFGGMRIYVDYHLPSEQISELEKIVIKYEKLSLRTCVVCAGCDIPFHKRSGYWDLVICESCFNKKG